MMRRLFALAYEKDKILSEVNNVFRVNLRYSHELSLFIWVEINLYHFLLTSYLNTIQSLYLYKKS